MTAAKPLPTQYKCNFNAIKPNREIEAKAYSRLLKFNKFLLRNFGPLSVVRALKSFLDCSYILFGKVLPSLALIKFRERRRFAYLSGS